MLTAGTLLLVNLYSFRRQELKPAPIAFVGDPDTLENFGWPLDFYTRGIFKDGSPSYILLDPLRLLLNLLFNLGLLVAIANICELFVRRGSRN